MIKKLKKLEDFQNKKILFSDEVMEALCDSPLEAHNDYLENHGNENVHSLYTDEKNDLYHLNIEFGLDCDIEFNEATEQEMHYSKEHGFYVEIEE